MGISTTAVGCAQEKLLYKFQRNNSVLSNVIKCGHPAFLKLKNELIFK